MVYFKVLYRLEPISNFSWALQSTSGHLHLKDNDNIYVEVRDVSSNTVSREEEGGAGGGKGRSGGGGDKNI